MQNYYCSKCNKLLISVPDDTEYKDIVNKRVFHEIWPDNDDHDRRRVCEECYNKFIKVLDVRSIIYIDDDINLLCADKEAVERWLNS